ncbi:hypothetical protein [Pseudoduganella violaceinigra]|uniref:hypothetical protein n=1 Tax=Pseudoduganella violaceinigra TaxID=246602 RepID=UPI0004804252|nr:hypothetical protein [Pseudoduganella violaceinigra]
MDIWKWVHDTASQLRKEGNDRLADLVYDLPTNASKGRMELATAALPEALAAAKAAGLPWLEVYFRHWIINPRVCTWKEGESALKETVELFDLAHRPETSSCPQSVCTTQDIACCYANVDGPGYAGDRLAVCNETLSRIDSSWSCFRCISAEKLNALVDASQPKEALAFADQQLPFLQESRADQSVDWLMPVARAQLAAGEFEAALANIDYINAKNFSSDNPAKNYARASLRFRLLAQLGRIEEAWSSLPPEEKGEEFGENLDLSLGLEILQQADPSRNDYRLGRRTAAALSRYSANGAHRLVLQALEPHVRMAAARGARWTALQALKLARPHLAKLKQPLGAPDAFAKLEALVAAMPRARALPVPPEQLAAYIIDSADDNAELAVEMLLAGLASRPADADMAAMASRAMRACGSPDAAMNFLWTFMRANRSSDEVCAELQSRLVEARDEAGLHALVDILREVDPSRAHWCLARFAFVNERWAEVGVHVERVLKLVPDAGPPRAMWADAAMRAGDYEKALDLLEVMVGNESEPGSAHWDALVAATAVRRWGLVRVLAHALGMKLMPGEGPIEEDWGWVRLQFVENGETLQRYARRTGPATARIASLSGTRFRQRLDSLLVFDPTPLEKAPEDAEEAKGFVHLFRVVTTLEESPFGVSYLVDGAKPRDEAFAAMTNAFEARGWKWSVGSEDSYTVVDSETEQEHPGIFFFLATPVGTAAAAIDEALRELTAGFEHALCWIGLATEANANVGHHEALMVRYEL